MSDIPSTDDVRDIWVDYHLNPLPRAEGIALVPEYQQAFDVWLETVRADERERLRHWASMCRNCGTTHHYDDYMGERRAHGRTTGMAPSMGWKCTCGVWEDRIEAWHAHLTGEDDKKHYHSKWENVKKGRRLIDEGGIDE